MGRPGRLHIGRLYHCKQIAMVYYCGGVRDELVHSSSLHLFLFIDPASKTMISNLSVSFATGFGPNIAITYVIDSHREITGEALVLINATKNLIAFAMILRSSEWITHSGYLQPYMIMFMIVALSMLLAIPMYIWGAKWRSSMASSRMARWLRSDA